MPDQTKQEFYISEQLSENISKTPEGYLLCQNVPVTRTGEFIYRANEVPIEANNEGIIRIIRKEEEVFKPEAIASLNGKSITINHPDSAVDPSNWKELTVGHVQNARRGEGDQTNLMIADLLITDEKAIELVNAGLREISLGYDAIYNQIEKGIGEQQNLIMNHCAIVDRGRAGSVCSINDKKTCDHCGTCHCKDKDKNSKQEDKGMKFKDKFMRLKKFFDAVSEEELEKLDKEEKTKDEDLPVKIKAIKDTYDKWIKDAEEGKLDLAKLPVELKEVKDEENLPVELKDLPVKTTKEADLTTTDEDEEKKKAAEEAEKKAAADKKTKDDEEAKKKEDEEKAKMAEDQKIKDAAAEAEKAEKAEEEEATKDCAANWHDILHRAEVLSPGIMVKKPTKDFAKALKEIKVKALKGAFATDSAMVASLVKKDPETLTKDALDAAFVGVSEIFTLKNNSKVQSPKAAKTVDFQSAVTVRDMNLKNKQFYKR